MAMVSSPAVRRQQRRRQTVVDEALDHAAEIMAEQGVGALTISEIARRMELRGPSLYKYFDSLHAVYDALFTRGVAGNAAAVTAAIEALPPGIDRLRVGAVATVRWCVEHPALAQLLYWRPVPGFAPSTSTFAASQRQMSEVQGEFAAAVECGELAPAAASGDAIRLFTVIMSGLISQQLANEPGAPYDTGLFTSLTEQAIGLFFDHYRRQ